MLANVWSVHHNEKYWTDPESFRPQRWIDQPELKKANFFIPFSTGLRVCPGRHLALMEAKLALARLIQKFTFAPLRPGPIDLTEEPGLATKPKSYKLVARRRK